MSASERAVSAFLIFHLIAIVTTAVARPPEERVRSDAPTVSHGALSRAVTPILNAVAAQERRAADWLWQTSGPLRVVTTTYTQAFGLGQKWSMFSNVPPYGEYLRLTFVIERAREDGAPRTRVVHQLVYPAWRLDQFRGVEGFRASYRNKTIEQVLLTFVRSTRDEWPGPRGSQRFIRTEDAPAGSDRLPFSLAALTRAYRNQYRERYLKAGEKIVRTEVWRGEAADRPAGEPGDERTLEIREATLDQFLEGPVTCHMCSAERPEPGSSGKEADILWVLYYVERSA
jgi:hypothetical protein